MGAGEARASPAPNSYVNPNIPYPRRGTGGFHSGSTFGAGNFGEKEVPDAHDITRMVTYTQDYPAPDAYSPPHAPPPPTVPPSPPAAPVEEQVYGRVQRLRLSSNNLVGTLPSTLGSRLAELKELQS